MTRILTNHDKETIINFNKAEDVAYIFTWKKTWQRHLEKKLGLKPLYDNGFGGREYGLPKKRIKSPRARRQLSSEIKAKLSERARGIQQKRNLGAETTITTV